MDKNVFIYDLEQFKNFHSGFFLNADTLEEHFFIIHPKLDQRNLYLSFIKTVKGLIGFNNLSYDYPLLQYIIDNPTLDVLDYYKFGDSLINSEKKGFQKIKIPQLDLFTIHHYNNRARRTSLKWIEFFLKLDNIMELPIKPGSIINEDQFELIRDYNRNDVIATKKFYDYTVSIGAIDLRKNITKEFGFNAMNMSDVSIGSKVTIQKYLNITKKNYNDIKDLRTYRSKIQLSQCIPSFIEFYSPILSEILKELKDSTIKSTKGELEFKFKIFNNVFKFKTGGLHTVDKPCILTPNDDEFLLELDVASMYPRSIIYNRYYPKHLGPEWLIGYEDIYDERLSIKHTNPARAAAFKLALNGGGFGKTNDEYSCMFDPLVTMQTTITGQLSLLMLIERLGIAGFQILSANTDGVVIKIKKSNYDQLFKICKEWEKITGYILEETYYHKLIMSNVNNYIAIKTDNKIKYKGWFEIDKEPHKNHSMRIIPIALKKFFVDNIDYHETIFNHEDEFDFFKAVKAPKESHFILKTIIDSCNYKIEELQKITRYYISNKGGFLYKLMPPLKEVEYKNTLFDEVISKSREFNIELNYLVTICNNYDKNGRKTGELLDINYEYYIRECEKIIKPIIGEC
jgi:hypothetical protein